MIECKIKKLPQKSRHGKYCYFPLCTACYGLCIFIGEKQAAAGQRGGAVEDVKNHELAEADYMSGMKYKDIAGKYGVSINTVKSWKRRYAWDRGNAYKQKRGCAQRKKCAGAKKGPAAKEVESVMGNHSLTDKQRCFNATKAYQKAYGVDYATAAPNGHRLLKNDKVREEIDRLKQGRLNREMLSEEDIVQFYIDILYSDITDYIDTDHNMVSLTGPLVDGRLIKKVSFGKTDSVELLDKAKALHWLSEHMDLATEEQRARIEGIKSRMETDKGRLSLEKKKFERSDW